jgi:Zn-dependent metalloprotease
MRKTLLLLVSVISILHMHAQPSLSRLEETIRKQRGASPFQVKLTSTTQGALRFSAASRLGAGEAKAWLSASLGLRAGKDDLQKGARVSHYNGGIAIEKYQQYYRGIKVEHGTINVLSIGGRVSAAQLEFYPLDESLAIAPALTEQEALAKALAYVGASKYVWEGYTGTDPQYKKPSGSLVFVEDHFGKKDRLGLAYKFQIYAEQPLSRSYVYVSAATGAVMLVDRIIKHASPDFAGSAGKRSPVKTPKADAAKKRAAAPFANASGTAQTRYSGSQNIVSDDGGSAAGKPYRLQQVRHGHNIATMNYERRVRSATNDGLAVDFSDNDNDWTTAENSTNYDDAALDAQYAMQVISDYWKNVHNRNSWDDMGGEMKSFVHVRSSSSPASGYDNAFWDGSAMYYGDGTYYATNGSGTVANAAGLKPLTSLDVSAHELGHAVCQSTANLVYQRESGAMNEGFSDIWAACVENYSGLSKQFFLIGEEIYPSQPALRSMQNPKQFFNPDTYGGQYWTRLTLAGCPIPSSSNDECGVHNNSGVLNKWFYLMTQGGSGTNDKGNMYSVSGLGFVKAEKIAFLCEQSLTPNADYAAARLAAINAAETLYGACSNEVIQVTNAWFAVGVGESSNCTPMVEFSGAQTSVTEGDGLAGACSSTKTVSVPVKLGSPATQKTDLQFSFGGTAVQGVNYSVASPVVSFNAGESGTKNLVLTLLDNATLEGTKTITLSYTINANGGNAAAGVNNQSHTITISDDDVLPLPVKSAPISTVTLLSEDFESATVGTNFPASWNDTLFFTGGGSAVNKWTIGTDGGLTGKSAYISTTPDSTNEFKYSTTSTTDRLLRLPLMNTTGLTNLRLSFKYKVGGEVDPVDPANTDPNYTAALWDYGRVVYDANGTSTTFSTLFNAESNDFVALYGNGATTKTFGPFQLPSTLENKAAIYLGFRWKNDNFAGNGFPLAVDDILVTGRTKGSSVETTLNESKTVKALPGNLDTYIAGSGGTALLAKLSNLSQAIPCLTTTVKEAGNGRTAITTDNGSYFRSKKVIQLTPGSPASSVTYNATFYFTAAELSGWSAAEIPQLKILKVKDGVDLSSTVTDADADVVAPVFGDHSADGYYTYTGSFTGFSQFMLVSPNLTLPVSLLRFEAQPAKNAIELSWTTATENNNKGFEIERSSNGRDYVSIGWVAGKGTTTSSTDYRFTDNFVQPGSTYQYRLKQVDTDNRFRYSPVRQVRITADGVTVSVSPNPAKGVLRIYAAGTTQLADVSLLDAKGQKVAEWKRVAVGSVYRANVSHVPAGVYTVVVHLPEENKTARVVLQ